ncbi:hypothetical protein D7X32_25220 [Corallococcus carmarthensis]|uniref:Uncharacterized protein n=1 Tax=Corallococcus carmarthensis TaxID=2316728 RepID=A0A3A8KDK7_9BACT|nr:hypothetical protein D7X32_25220 [Corallococcus carmarthensis]
MTTGCDDEASSTDAAILFTMGTGVGGFGSTCFGTTTEGGGDTTFFGTGGETSLGGGLPVNVGGGDDTFTTFCVTGCDGGPVGMENCARGWGRTGVGVTVLTDALPPSETVVPEAHLSHVAPG